MNESPNFDAIIIQWQLIFKLNHRKFTHQTKNDKNFDLLKMSQKIGEKSFTKQIENFSESIDISKKITKIGENLFIENDPPKIGEKSFTKKVKILVNQHKFL